MPTHLVVSLVAIASLCLSCFGQAFTERDQAFMGVVGLGDITNACDITHNLLSKWTFDEGGGVTVYDKKGARNGTLSAVAGHSLPQWNTPGFGSYQTNINLPDSYSYITFGNDHAWTFYTNWNWTLTIWAQHTNSIWKGIEGLVSVNTSTPFDSSPKFELKYSGEQFVNCTPGSDHWVLSIPQCAWVNAAAPIYWWDMCALRSTTVTNLTQYFWTIVRENDNVFVYTNGTLAVSNRFLANGRPQCTNTATPCLWVGGDFFPGADRNFRGNIQEMRIYLASLTATEITNLWNHLANNGPCP